MNMFRKWSLALALIAAIPLLAAAKQWVVVHHPWPPPTPSATGLCGGAAAPASYDHVIWIWMENKSVSSVLGDPAATYERQLAASCATATDGHDIGSPSLPNYLGATSGSTWGVADDAGPDAHPLTVDNLFRQVRASGRGERSYEEAMPSACALNDSGTYAVRHNPATYYTGGDDRAACQRDDIPMGSLGSGALASAIDQGALPAFAFITPDTCNDTHDCSVGTGDQWLSRWIPRLTQGPNYRAGRTAIFVAWDESTPMPLFVIAPSVPPGLMVSTPVDHYAELRTAEEMLALPLLGRASSAVSLRPAFHI